MKAHEVLKQITATRKQAEATKIAFAACEISKPVNMGYGDGTLYRMHDGSAVTIDGMGWRAHQPEQLGTYAA